MLPALCGQAPPPTKHTSHFCRIPIQTPQHRISPPPLVPWSSWVRILELRCGTLCSTLLQSFVALSSIALTSDCWARNPWGRHFLVHVPTSCLIFGVELMICFSVTFRVSSADLMLDSVLTHKPLVNIAYPRTFVS